MGRNRYKSYSELIEIECDICKEVTRAGVKVPGQSRRINMCMRCFDGFIKFRQILKENFEKTIVGTWVSFWNIQNSQ